MFNIGFPELALIFTAALLLLGPQKLPEFARWMGQALRELRQATHEVRNAIDMELEREEFEKLQQEFQHTINTDLSLEANFSIPPDDQTKPVEHDHFDDFQPASNQDFAYPPVDQDTLAAHPELADEWAHITQPPPGTIAHNSALDDSQDELPTPADHPTPDDYPETPVFAETKDESADAPLTPEDQSKEENQHLPDQELAPNDNPNR